MIRSTRAQKAERLRAARRLLADEIGMAEAAMALSRTFGLSRRQAYRYLELARAAAPVPSAAKNSITITLKMPESLALCGPMRPSAASRQARSSGRPLRLSWAGKAPAWLSSGRYGVLSISSSHSIGCSLPSSSWPTTSWSHRVRVVGSDQADGEQTMKIAAIYARVSSDKQREENTIASQTAALIAFAREQQYEVPEEWVFEDDGYSGANRVGPDSNQSAISLARA